MMCTSAPSRARCRISARSASLTSVRLATTSTRARPAARAECPSVCASCNGRRRSGSFVRSSQNSAPATAPTSSATPTATLTSAPTATDATITTPIPTTRWKASASERTGLRIRRAPFRKGYAEVPPLVRRRQPRAFVAREGGQTRAMKLIILGASGLLGTRLVTEALDRGHEVTAVARDGARLDDRDGRVHTASADATDPESVAAVAGGHEVAISAVTNHQAPEMLVDAARGLLDGLARAGVGRLISVGGAGSLEVAPGERLVDTPDFHDEWKPEALAGAAALEVFRD